MTQLFGAKLFSCNSCRCRSETCSETTTLLTQLLYPDNYVNGKLLLTLKIKINIH